jgi:NodT family efflux transporter outer membrane factor (OMF) lipoprotein
MRVVFTSMCLAVAALAGCAAIPDGMPHSSPVQAATLGLARESASIDAQWWKSFGDPQLDRLVDTALSGNPTLDAALARVRAADSMVDVQHAAELPQVDAEGQALSQRFSNRYLIPPPYRGTVQQTGTLQTNLSWDLDLFGRQKAAVARARSDASQARLDADAARMTISSSVAQAYVSLVRANRQVDVAKGFVETRRQALGYVKSRVSNQLAGQIELRTAETLLAQAQQAQVRAEAQREQLVHALSALVGHGADFYGNVTMPSLDLNTRPVVPDLLPGNLLGRRADLLAGQARIESATAGLQIARADFLPDVNLQALAGFASIGLGGFLSSDALTYGAGAAIHIPIFEGGRLRARYRGATAELDVALAQYRSAVLGAVRDSADALTSIHAADAELVQQERVVSGLRDTVRLDQVRVSTGLGSNLDAIDSGFRLLEAEQALVDLQADALESRIQLIAALGGGYVPNTPASPVALAK